MPFLVYAQDQGLAGLALDLLVVTEALVLRLEGVKEQTDCGFIYLCIEKGAVK